MVACLIEKCSADPTIEDIEGQAAIHYAVDFDHELLVQWFIDKFGIGQCIEGMTGQQNPEQGEKIVAESNILCRSAIKGSWKACCVISYYLFKEPNGNQTYSEYFIAAKTIAEMCGHLDHYNQVLLHVRKAGPGT